LAAQLSSGSSWTHSSGTSHSGRTGDIHSTRHIITSCYTPGSSSGGLHTSGMLRWLMGGYPRSRLYFKQLRMAYGG
jgi:hypothetical protein